MCASSATCKEPQSHASEVTPAMKDMKLVCEKCMHAWCAYNHVFSERDWITLGVSAWVALGKPMYSQWVLQNLQSPKCPVSPEQCAGPPVHPSPAQIAPHEPPVTIIKPTPITCGPRMSCHKGSRLLQLGQPHECHTTGTSWPQALRCKMLLFITCVLPLWAATTSFM